jgi:transposase-like protein
LKSQTREEKGREIADLGQVKRLEDGRYQVNSQSGKGVYEVLSTETGWKCVCPDHEFREVKCKHIYAVEFSQSYREQVQTETTIRPLASSNCRACGSEQVVKNALRHNKYGDIQRYSCRDCGKRFSVNIGFEGMRASPEAITQAMQLYFTGESLRNVQKFLQLQGVNISHVSVYKWIRKYVGLMQTYLDRLTPRVSDTWRADELYLKVKGDMKYLFALMDDETRFWIAEQISDGKFTADVRPLFAEGKRVAGKRPMTLITDGGMHFTKPFKREFYTNTNPKSVHIRDIRFDGSVHNNKMERLNGEVRDRGKDHEGSQEARLTNLEGVSTLP